jgi:hypothetical protein
MHGEVITVVQNPPLAFCYSDAMGECLQAYLFSMQEPRMLIGNPYQYHMPLGVDGVLLQKKPTWRSKVLNFLGINRSQ